MTELEQAALRLADNEECHYDHEGLCQSHSLHTKPCPMGIINKYHSELETQTKWEVTVSEPTIYKEWVYADSEEEALQVVRDNFIGLEPLYASVLEKGSKPGKVEKKEK